MTSATITTGTVKFGDIELTNYPAEHLAIIKRNLDEGIPFPLEIDIEKSIPAKLLTENQAAQVRQAKTRQEKHRLVAELLK